MTAPVSQQTVLVKDAATVRKRKRRAPSRGAADDCFTCSKRDVKCDRRRPYCSQCLEFSNECSGYKTKLTWGVGVASRGKFRGLSLPIAKAPPVLREPKKSPISRRRATSIAAVKAAQLVEQEDSPRRSGPIDIRSVQQHHSVSRTTDSYPGVGRYDHFSISGHEHTSHVPQHSWSSIPYSPDVVHSPDITAKYSKFRRPLITDELSSSVDSASDVDYLSPLSQTYSRDEIPFGGGSSVVYDGYHRTQHSPAAQSPPTKLVLDHACVPASCPGLMYAASEQSSSLKSHLDPFDTHLNHKLMRECDSLSVPQVDIHNASCSPAGHGWILPHMRDDELQSPQSEIVSNRWSAAVREPDSVRMSPDLVARMPFFMDYYKNTIAPYMVYMDGPTNPFRDHVLQLATHSQSLQHAICALSACNLRMKRKLSLGQDTCELFDKLMAGRNTIDGLGNEQSDDPSLNEEFQHRNLAVNLLNEQLNDPVKSTDDSVLATILLLCHYRMVESGVAKFHTQFVGVKKILAMRTEQVCPSQDSVWIKSLFTYFDAISASINDREAQLASGLDDGSPQLFRGVENLIGCDRELFKTISKLGRLNLLFQNRPVQNMGPSPCGRTDDASSTPSYQMVRCPLGYAYKGSVGSNSRSIPISQSQQRQQQQSLQHLSSMYTLPGPHLDGDGFGTSLHADEILASAMYTSAAFDDRRSLFWREWRDARLALQNWQFDAATVAASLPGSPSTCQIRDLGSLSEAFRYAALLYTERLAIPSMPSSHTNFQNLVSQVVYYATSLDTGSKAEKFLLWPLFVAGSECVNELQRNIVRTKCRSIMSRSGYMNNLSALDVLEKLWAGDFKPGNDLRSHRGPFNWAKCFDSPGTETEWIMF